MPGLRHGLAMKVLKMELHEMRRDLSALHIFIDREHSFQAALGKVQPKFSKLPKFARKVLKTLLSQTSAPMNLPRCNPLARKLAAEAMKAVFAGWRREHPNDVAVSITYAPERWNTDPDAAEVDVAKMHGQTYHSLLRLGVQGVTIYEDVNRAGWVESGVKRPKQLMPHIHVLGVFAGTFDDLKKAIKVERRRRSLRNQYAPSIKAVKIVHTDADYARCAAYAFKPAHKSVRLRRQKRRPTRWKLESLHQRFSGRDVLRQIEVQSHISVVDAVGGVGPAGSELRRLWRDNLLTLAAAEKLKPVISATRLRQTWKAVHERILPGKAARVKVRGFRSN